MKIEWHQAIHDVTNADPRAFNYYSSPTRSIESPSFQRLNGAWFKNLIPGCETFALAPSEPARAPEALPIAKRIVVQDLWERR